MVVAGCVAGAFAHTSNPLAEMRAATYSIHAGEISCSAVVIAPGKVLTAAHCADGYVRLNLRDDTLIDLKLVAKKSELDVALFTADIGCPCIPLSEDDAQVDEDVFVVGYPMGKYTGFVQFLTAGKAQGISAHGLNITAPIVSGNSGGPVIVSRQGRLAVVGIVSQVLLFHQSAPITHMALAVPARAIQDFLK